MIDNIFKKWAKNEEGVAAMEAGLIFPVLLVMMLGVIDTGMALIVNKKLINASQMVSDVLARNETVTDDDITDAVVAAELALEPYSSDGLGLDIVGIFFEGAGANPTVEWRDTYNMDPNESVLEDSDGLGDENEGLIAVTVVYTYTPPFSSFAVGTIEMEEVAFVRGRQTPFVTRE